MRRLPFVFATLVAATAVASGADRVLDFSKPATGIKGVAIEAGVGDVEVVAEDGGTISARVEIERKGGGFWGSHSSRQDIDELEVDARLDGATLRLALRPKQRHNRNFSESWTVRVPASCAVKIELGVGEATVRDVAADIAVEVGVGDVEIDGLFKTFGTIAAECGVGDVSVRTPDGRESGEGFIGHEVRTKGAGNATLDVEAGVGDVTIRLR